MVQACLQVVSDEGMKKDDVYNPIQDAREAQSIWVSSAISKRRAALQHAHCTHTTSMMMSQLAGLAPLNSYLMNRSPSGPAGLASLDMVSFS